MFYEGCRQHSAVFRRDLTHQGMKPLLEMKMALDFEGNDNQNRACCAQNLFQEGILLMSNLIPSPNNTAVLMTVFFRTYKKEFKCDGHRRSLPLPHVLFSSCLLVYILSRIPFIFKCILKIILLFPSSYPALAIPQKIIFLIQLLKKYFKIDFLH